MLTVRTTRTLSIYANRLRYLSNVYSYPSMLCEPLPADERPLYTTHLLHAYTYM